jgi:hypothetical protein
MASLLSGPAIFRVGDRDEIVDEIDGTDVGTAHPLLEPGIVEAGVTDVEIKSSVATAFFTGSGLYQLPYERWSNVSVRTGQDFEKLSRILAAKDPPESPMLDDGLCVLPEMIEIGEADPVDPGRVAPCPSTPNQAGDVEQQRCVVGQGGPD